MKKFGSFLLGVILGAIVGAAIAALLAPESGADTQTMLKGKVQSIRDEVIHAANTRGEELRLELEKMRKPVE